MNPMNKQGIVASEDPAEQAQDMPGVAEESPQDVGAGEPVAPPTGGPEGEDEQSNVTPEEQAMYDATVSAAYKLLYSNEAAFKGIVDQLKSFDDRPAFGIGHIAAMTMLSVRKTIEKQGKTIPDDVLFAAGQEIVSDLARIGVAVGIIPKGQEDDVIKASYFEGMKAFGQALQDEGKLTPDVQRQAQQDVQQTGKGKALLAAAQQQGAAQPAAPEQQPAAPAAGIANQPGA